MGVLEELMKGETGGHPISGIKWSRRSTRHLSKALIRSGHPASPRTVSRLLRGMGFSLHVNVKRLSGPRHPDREKQFQAIRRQVQNAQRKGLPVLSVDTKKKELIGSFSNAGRVWSREATAVSDHDFLSQGIGKAVPFGIYDVKRNRGMVVVGNSRETATFGVDALSQWYRREGRKAYPHAKELLILCDNGGCNGSVNRLWKYELQGFTDTFGLRVRVAHYPPRASKWNPIEHRLFSFITKNWAGQPLVSFETMLNHIRTTRTTTGLTVRAVMLPGIYETGVEVTEEEMAALRIRRSRTLPRWNYSIHPRQN